MFGRSGAGSPSRRHGSSSLLARQGRRAVGSSRAGGTSTSRSRAGGGGASRVASGAGGTVGHGFGRTLGATDDRRGLHSVRAGHSSPHTPAGSLSPAVRAHRNRVSAGAASSSPSRHTHRAVSSSHSASAAASSSSSSSGSASATSRDASSSRKRKLASFKVSDLELKTTVGTGTFGRVRVVKHRPTGRHFALKMMRKVDIVRLRQVEHVKSEVAILAECEHPFIVNLVGVSTDSKRLYLLMEYVSGGELFTKLRADDTFPVHQARFYTAEITLAFAYLHGKGIVYRDLKPENLLFSTAGHIKITDFGFAKRVGVAKTYTVCGTPEYLAPEIIQSRGHGVPVDWWALGVLLYEMLAGLPPYFDETPYGIYQKILRGRLRFPKRFDAKAADLVSKLLTPDPTRRLGCMRGGSADVQAHRFFAKLDWEAAASCSIEPPYVPAKLPTVDSTRHFPEEYPDSDDEAAEPSSDEQMLFLAFDSF